MALVQFAYLVWVSSGYHGVLGGHEVLYYPAVPLEWWGQVMFARHIVGVALAAALGVPFFWAIDRDPPLMRLDGDVQPISPQGIKPGAWVDFCWTVRSDGRWCPGVVHSQIIASDRHVYLLEDDGATYHVGATKICRPRQLPSTLPPGEARYHALVQYWCNPLHYFWPINSAGPDVTFKVD